MHEMGRSDIYRSVLFQVGEFAQMIEALRSVVGNPCMTVYRYLKVTKGETTHSYNSIDDFLASVDGDFSHAYLWCENPDIALYVSTGLGPRGLLSTVKIESDKRSNIAKLHECVARLASEVRASLPPSPTIFIGHGRSPQWRDLRDHLKDKHGYEVKAYETGSRAGSSVQEVLGELLDESSFAILVMTGEDQLNDGKVRARQNVIYELGLFHGRLGFCKGIMVKEDAVEEFSNISGVQQIRYTTGSIRETFGDVVAALKREFPPS